MFKIGQKIGLICYNCLQISFSLWINVYEQIIHEFIQNYILNPKLFFSIEISLFIFDPWLKSSLIQIWYTQKSRIFFEFYWTTIQHKSNNFIKSSLNPLLSLFLSLVHEWTNSSNLQLKIVNMTDNQYEINARMQDIWSTLVHINQRIKAIKK